ncbi:MAG: hypothetical protein IJA34_00950 [Lachnospiraceae bacterium]|nr:hypothetical protein [Lachnospiraceae bacterium]
MACDMRRIANLTKAKQELVAMGIDHYTGDLKDYVADNVKTDAKSVDDQIRNRIKNDVMNGAEFDYRSFRKYKNDIYEVLEVTLDQTLPEGWNDNEFFNRYVETIRVDLGDINEFYSENNSLLTVSKFAGNHWDTIRERFDIGTSFSIPTGWYDVHFYNEFERFMKGVDSWIKLIDKARKSFLQFFQNAAYVAFSNLGDELPEGFVGNGALISDTEKDAFLEIADRVATDTGKKVTFVGSVQALRKLQGKIEDNWIPESLREERAKNGVISTYEGYELLVLPQVFKAGTFDFELSTDKILMVASNAKPIKFVFEGKSRMKEIDSNTTNQDQTLEGQIQVKAGMGVAVDELFGCWTLA